MLSSSLLVCNLLTLFAFFGFLSRLQTFPSFLDEDIDEVTDAGPLSAPARSDEAASYAEQEDEEEGGFVVADSAWSRVPAPNIPPECSPAPSAVISARVRLFIFQET